jgi:hypothetical protein
MPAAPPPPQPGQRQQHPQQEALQQQHQQQQQEQQHQQQQQQRPQGRLQLGQVPASSDMDLDAAGADDMDSSWLQQQLELLLRDVDDIADEADGLRLTRAAKRKLEQQFTERFRAMLQRQQSPPQHQVRTWLRSRLGVPEQSYDSSSDGDDQPLPEDPHPPQQRQQRLRRSSRGNLGVMGTDYAALHGPTMGSHVPSKPGGTTGKQGGNSSSCGHRQQPLTSATTAPQPPARRRSGRRQT